MLFASNRILVSTLVLNIVRSLFVHCSFYKSYIYSAPDSTKNTKPISMDTAVVFLLIMNVYLLKRSFSLIFFFPYRDKKSEKITWDYCKNVDGITLGKNYS